MKNFYRMRDVCQELQVSRSTIWRWCRNGAFPQPRKFGQGKKLIGWCGEDIAEYLSALRNG